MKTLGISLEDIDPLSNETDEERLARQVAASIQGLSIEELEILKGWIGTLTNNAVLQDVVEIHDLAAGLSDLERRILLSQTRALADAVGKSSS